MRKRNTSSSSGSALNSSAPGLRAAAAPGGRGFALARPPPSEVWSAADSESTSQSSDAITSQHLGQTDKGGHLRSALSHPCSATTRTETALCKRQRYSTTSELLLRARSKPYEPRSNCSRKCRLQYKHLKYSDKKSRTVVSSTDGGIGFVGAKPAEHSDATADSTRPLSRSEISRRKPSPARVCSKLHMRQVSEAHADPPAKSRAPTASISFTTGAAKAFQSSAQRRPPPRLCAARNLARNSPLS
mmetsp:Transcript_61709/g.201374  ORF Transcript_61709/g.201374 Transcript_61709/m.201374 type:complete len:245 (+) Transcript_61709:354-1088(+)